MNRELRIALIGAGNVNFGGGEGPWDHASRLEKLGGVRIVAVVDPDLPRARHRLQERSATIYRDAKAYADCRPMLAETKPDAVWIGVPPDRHGSLETSRDIERCCAAAGVHLFIEKPLSADGPDTVRAVAELVVGQPVLTSVGYMFRYSQAVAKIRAILAAGGHRIGAFLARYNCAYSEIRKRAWWDTRCTGGPIVEQATHFVDLARYLVGEADLASVRAVCLPGDAPLGQLQAVPQDDEGRPLEQGVPEEFRVPRVTLAVWRFATGAAGSLNHGAMLHARKYDTEIEIWADGLRMVLADPYGECRLHVRHPHTETVEEFRFAGDDPYLHEDRAFLEAVRTGDASLIRSSYADAVRTHELAWTISAQAKSAAVRSP